MGATGEVVGFSAERATLQFVVSAPDTITELTRTDDNGTAAVRVPAGTLPIVAATRTVYDYEAALHGTVTWQAYGASALLVETTWDWAAHEAGGLRGWAWLTCPRRPALSTALNDGDGAAADVVVLFDANRAAATTVHRVIGRADPVAVLHPLPLRTGTLDIVCPTLAEAHALMLTLAQPEVWMLRQTDQTHLDFHFVVTALDQAHAEEPHDQPERRWTVTVTFAEVARLPGEVTLNPDWTYNDVTATNQTYASLLSRYPTYTDLLLGGE